MIVIDHNKIIIEAFTGIQFISDTLIEIKSVNRLIAITGTSLVVSGLSRYEITIKGNIGGLEFHEIHA